MYQSKAFIRVIFFNMFPSFSYECLTLGDCTWQSRFKALAKLKAQSSMIHSFISTWSSYFDYFEFRFFDIELQKFSAVPFMFKTLKRLKVHYQKCAHTSRKRAVPNLFYTTLHSKSSDCDHSDVLDLSVAHNHW